MNVSSFFTLADLLLAPLAALNAGDLPKHANKPNVLLIVSDDLNDDVETFGGHPRAQLEVA